MEYFAYLTGFGSPAISPVHARFQSDGVEHVVISCGRMDYDPNPPFAVMRLEDGTIKTEPLE